MHIELIPRGTRCGLLISNEGLREACLAGSAFLRAQSIAALLGCCEIVTQACIFWFQIRPRRISRVSFRKAHLAADEGFL